MRSTPRFFSSKLSARERRVYKGATFFFVAIFLASMWPVYPLFSRIEPSFLGIPLSLTYLIVLLLLCFVAVVGLYLWQERRGELD